MKVLMVCLGNICRSPLAHGILEEKIRRFQLDWQVDSAGTNGFHNGERPDPRSIAVARTHDIDISRQVSRQIQPTDVEDFDLILVMDSSNYRTVMNLCRDEAQRNKVKKLMEYAYSGENRDVPDPYYTGGFEYVYSMIEQAVDGLIKAHRLTIK